MTDSFFVRDFMLENPVKISPDATIDEAAKMLIDNRISGLTVVDAQDNVVGVLSELDCLRATISTTYNEGNTGSGLVGEYMTSTVDSLSPDDDLVSVAQSMLQARQRRRPVVKDGKLVGQVSCRNILWAVGNYVSRGKKQD